MALARLRGHTDVVISCDVSPDGAWIATGGRRLGGTYPTRTIPRVLPPLINIWIVSMLDLDRALNMTPIIDCNGWRRDPN